MPIRERALQRTDVPSERELRDELEAEFANPKESGEPEIIIERPAPGTTHLYVIWSRWAGVEQLVRSRIILDAYEATQETEEVLKVTVSMGLTPDESDRLGVT